MKSSKLSLLHKQRSGSYDVIDEKSRVDGGVRVELMVMVMVLEMTRLMMKDVACATQVRAETKSMSKGGNIYITKAR